MKTHSDPPPLVVTLGECMAVLFPGDPVGIDHSATLRLDIAGTEANTAIGLARQGIAARFVSRVGDDPFGRRIRDTLAREGVDTTCLVTDRTAPTGVFFREPLADGMRRVYYYRARSAASRMTPADVTLKAFRDAWIVHLSGITPALSRTCAATVRRAIAMARKVGALVSFDPNYRKALWDAATARAALLLLVKRVDLLLLSDEDAQVLFGTTNAGQVLKRAAALGPRTVVLKQAGKGATALFDGERFHVGAARIKRVVDSVGAGDGFNAGFMAGMLKDREIAECLAMGAEAGARAVETLGDYAGYPRTRKPGTRGKAR